MKRNKKLLRLLMVSLRDDLKIEPSEEHSEDELGFHAAMLIREGYAEGAPFQNETGQYTGAALDCLTSKGYDFFESLEETAKEEGASDMKETNLEVFISHSSEDAEVAEALVELLQASLRLGALEIRCTSVAGFKMPVGVDGDEQLRLETVSARAFIGLITPKSIQSAYVLFELGARWGAKRAIFPVFAKGADAKFLKGPLHSITALDARVSAEAHQLVSDVGTELGRPTEQPAVFLKHLSRFVDAASKVEESAPTDELGIALQKMVSPVPTRIRNDILRAFLKTGSLTTGNFARASGLSQARAEFFL